MAVPGGEIVATCSNFQRDVLWGKVLISGLFVSRRKVRGGSVARWEIAATVGNRSEILFPGSSCPRDLTYPGEEKKRSFRNNNLSLPRETLSLLNSIFPALPPLILSRSLFSPKSSNRSNSFVSRVVRPLRPETIIPLPNEFEDSVKDKDQLNYPPQTQTQCPFLSRSKKKFSGRQESCVSRLKKKESRFKFKRCDSTLS